MQAEHFPSTNNKYIVALSYWSIDRAGNRVLIDTEAASATSLGLSESS